MAVTQRKETGAIVDFTNSIKINDFQKYTYRNDVIGVRAYQGIPATIDGAIRDALLNANLGDIVTQAGGQGMQVQHAVISWNETLQANGTYYFTDLVIGIVFQVTRDYNTSPAYMVTSLEAVSWLGQIMSRLKLPWEAWQLMNPARGTDPYNHWVDESVSQELVVTGTSDALPPLPDASTVKATVKSQGAFQNALGTFTTQMLDKGYTVTYPTNAYDIDICFEQGLPFRSPTNPNLWAYKYKVHVRFWWDFTTVPDVTTNPNLARQLSLTVTAIIAIIVVIGALMMAGIVAYNLTHSHSEYVKFEVLRDKDGNPILDANGNPIIYVSEKGSSDEPPDFWGYVIPVIALIGVGAGVYVFLQLIPRRKEK